MTASSLTPVFVGLRTGLHVLVAALLGIVVGRVLLTDPPQGPLVLALATAFAAVYAAARPLRRWAGPRWRTVAAVWVLVLVALWIAVVTLLPEAAYLAFPLFFLLLHVLPRAVGTAAVLGTAGVAILALGLHEGFTAGGVVGPLVGTGVAILIGRGYQALVQEAHEREELLAELVAARDRLAATEREQGRLAERARLAREIHDTVAQDLSSIQMLLHAAGRTGPGHPAEDTLELARTTAAAALAETRRVVRDLSPAALDQGLGPALARLGDGARREGLRVDVEVPESIGLDLDGQSALLRIAQGAVANVLRHARAEHLRLRYSEDGHGARLVVEDDGVGFDPAAVRSVAQGTDSFGLRAIAERVAQRSGRLELDSAPGRGARVLVVLPRSTP